MVIATPPTAGEAIYRIFSERFLSAGCGGFLRPATGGTRKDCVYLGLYGDTTDCFAFKFGLLLQLFKTMNMTHNTKNFIMQLFFVFFNNPNVCEFLLKAYYSMDLGVSSFTFFFLTINSLFYRV